LIKLVKTLQGRQNKQFILKNWNIIVK
jgi:hypothetical protein